MYSLAPPHRAPSTESPLSRAEFEQLYVVLPSSVDQTLDSEEEEGESGVSEGEGCLVPEPPLDLFSAKWLPPWIRDELLRRASQPFPDGVSCVCSPRPCAKTLDSASASSSGASDAKAVAFCDTAKGDKGGCGASWLNAGKADGDLQGGTSSFNAASGAGDEVSCFGGKSATSLSLSFALKAVLPLRDRRGGALTGCAIRKESATSPRV